MAHHRSTQASFSGGIVSRELWSRTDFSKLSSCVADAVNFRLRPSGSASYRSGMRYLGDAAVEDGSAEERLHPFVFSREDCGILEFFVSPDDGNLKMRFIKNKEYVTNPDGSIYTFSIRTSWDSLNYSYDPSNLKNLSIAQSKNKLFICGPNLVPTYIERREDNDWSQSFIQLGLSNRIKQPTSVIVTPGPEPDTTVQFDKYYWGATVVLEDGTESALTRSAATQADVELAEQPCDVEILADFSGLTEEEKSTAQIFIYRVSGGIMYFIYALRYSEGSATENANIKRFTFKDVGFAVDKSHTEPVVLKAFRGISNTAPAFTDNTPTVCAIYKQRLILASSKNDPNKFWLSKIGNMDDFTYRVSVTDEMAFDREFDAGDEDKIVGFIPMDDLLVGTQSKIWRVTGSTSSTMNAFIETYDGMRGRPLVSKKSVLYLNGVSNSLNNFLYSEQHGGYVGEELDLLSKELFDGYKIIGFDLQSYPVQSIYALRSDNNLLCITYVKEQNIYGWFKIETHGNIKNLCVLSGEDQDDLYVIVERDGKCYVECFEPDYNYSDTQDSARFLDSYEEIVHDGSTKVGPVTRFANRAMTLYHRGDVKEVYFDNDGYAEIPKELYVPEGDTVVIGYSYTGILKLLPREIQTSQLDTVGLKRRISGSVYVRVYNTRGLKMGASESTLEEIKPYLSEDFTTDKAIPLYTGLLECTALDESDAESSFLIRQDYPLPAFIQSVTSEVDYETKSN